MRLMHVSKRMLKTTVATQLKTALFNLVANRHMWRQAHSFNVATTTFSSFLNLGKF